MVGWHHRLNGQEFEQTPGDNEGLGSLVCCSSRCSRVRHDLVPEQQHSPEVLNQGQFCCQMTRGNIWRCFWLSQPAKGINYQRPQRLLGFPGGTSGKEPACQCKRRLGTPVPSLGPDDPREEGMATHSSTLAWRVPWAEEPDGLQTQGHKELGTTEVTWREHTQRGS